MIRIDSIWLATEPMDMRAGTDTALARVVAVFGAAKPHCAYLFANRRANRMKVLVHDGVGIWLAARRLHQGRFFWPGVRHGSELDLDAEQLQALGARITVAKSRCRRCYYRAVKLSATVSLPAQLSDQSIVAKCLLWQSRRHDFVSESRPTEP
ncbi:IS66 family insertion sequence element accessory protein TnpB [Pseudomonas tolaasii]